MGKGMKAQGWVGWMDRGTGREPRHNGERERDGEEGEKGAFIGGEQSRGK